jgi:uridine kinase
MPFIIAIDGEGAAGKSTLAGKLQKALPRSVLVETDYFCYPPSGKDGEWWGPNVPNYGVDWKRLRDQVVVPFSKGEKVLRYEVLNWDTYKLDRVERPHDADVLIIEGAHALRRELREFYTFSIWVDSDDKGRLDRVKKRDGAKMIPYWEKEFIPLVKAYVEDHDPAEAANVLFRALTASDVGTEALIERVCARIADAEKRRRKEGAAG